MQKLFSGRFIFTVVCALVFGYSAVMKIITNEQIISIIIIVIGFYFARTDRFKGEQK